MRRLYLQIYLVFVAVLLLFGMVMALTWWLTPADNQEGGTLDGMRALLAQVLPPPERPLADLRREVERLAKQFNADVTVRANDGVVLAQAGTDLPLPAAGRMHSGWIRSAAGPMLALHLSDGRWVLARWKHRRHGFGVIGAFVLLAAVLALGTYPIARRIAGRLERLQARVEALGAGNLQARVQVEGCDEVAELARSFNRAADRIEGLVKAQSGVLASASHELRSPLTRMRMAIELLPVSERPELVAQLYKDIAELDALIDELLLASRLEALDRPARTEEIDVLALLAEEAARTGAQVSGQPATIRGDARMLRRLLRNLLENGKRYAAGSLVEGCVEDNGLGVVSISVCDRGPGIAEEERERVFQPFYRPPGTKEGDGGVGLGLALVRDIARHHGGDVAYVPREGGGSCFVVKLTSAEPGKN